MGSARRAGANPFAPTDAFCTKAGPAPTKGTIKVVQIRSQLEKYEPLGYSLPVGDVNDMFQVFTDQINACGGIRGRKVVLENEEYDPTNPASRDAACIAATEDDKAFVVVNANTLTGTGPICVAGDHKTPLVYVGGAPDSAYQSTNGRLASYGPSADGQLRLLAGDLVASNALKGKKVAIASTDLPDQVDVIQRALVDPLKKRGVDVVVYDVMPCQGNIVCTQPIPQSVMKVAAAKPDVVLPILTATTLPVYVNEMKRAGIKAKLYESSYNALGPTSCRARCCRSAARRSPTTTRAPPSSRPRSPATGAFRFRSAADRRDVQRHLRREHHDRRHVRPDTEGYAKRGMVGLSCTNMRMVARAMYDAGENLTQQTFVEDAPASSARPDRRDRRRARRRLHRQEDDPDHPFEARATYPCKLPAPPEDTICLIPVSTKGRTDQAVVPACTGPNAEPASQRERLFASFDAGSWRVGGVVTCPGSRRCCRC